MPNESLNFAIGRLPHASEVFGTYRPMVGWASKRDRIISDGLNSLAPFLRDLLPLYATGNEYSGSSARDTNRYDIGRLARVSLPKIAPADDGTFMIPALQSVVLERLRDQPAPSTADEWRAVVNEHTVRQAYGDLLHGAVGAWNKWADGVPGQFPLLPGESSSQHDQRLNEFICSVLDRESRLAAR